MHRLRTVIALSAIVVVPAAGSVGAYMPPTTSDTTYEHATGSDDVIMQIDVSGGLVPTDIAFTNTPSLVITGDGRMVMQGPYTMEFPGPLLPNLQQRTISEDGIQAYLTLADEFSMLAQRSYEGNDQIMDAPGTTLTITVGDETFTHSAYALGLGTGPNGEETDPDRAELNDFVRRALDPEAFVNEDDLGELEPFEGDSYLILARASEGEYGTEIKPTVFDWPAAASVRLADASQCTEVPVDELGTLLEDADEVALFVDDGVTYHVAATPRPPGRHCS